MADELSTTGTESQVQGQVDSGPGDFSARTTEPAPEAGAGQPEGSQTQQTTPPASADSGPAEGQAEDSFFDPKDIQDKPELMAAYKQMQGAFSKKMAGLAQDRRKIEAYDAFNADPISTMQQFAQRLGYQLTPAQAAQAAQAMEQQQQAEWEPESWNDVMAKATQQAKAEIFRDLQPFIGHIQQVQKSQIESHLDEAAPDWRQYETEMSALLKQHPSLAKDPVALYRLAVPPEVLESRATQQALKRLQAKTDAARISGASQTSKKPGLGPEPGKSLSFAESVAFAKQRLAEQGIKPG